MERHINFNDFSTRQKVDWKFLAEAWPFSSDVSFQRSSELQRIALRKLHICYQVKEGNSSYEKQREKINIIWIINLLPLYIWTKIFLISYMGFLLEHLKFSSRNVFKRVLEFQSIFKPINIKPNAKILKKEIWLTFCEYHITSNKLGINASFK